MPALGHAQGVPFPQLTGGIPPAPPAASHFLLESTGYLLLESGGFLNLE